MNKSTWYNLSIAVCAALALAVMHTGCESSSSSSSGNSNLDENLFGKWVFVNAQDEVMAYEFQSDGTCIQHIAGEDYHLRWELEDGLLKFYVEGGIPHYKEYKIVGNQLYFYVDQIDDWGLPFTKL